jgi:hypothetical protein
VHVLWGTFVSLVMATVVLVVLFLATDNIWVVWNQLALPLVSITIGLGLAVDALRAYRRSDQLTDVA